jgi:hypothetical protein
MVSQRCRSPRCRELPDLIDPANTGSAIWADTAYRSQKNERAKAKIGLANIAFNFKSRPIKTPPRESQGRFP